MIGEPKFMSFTITGGVSLSGRFFRYEGLTVESGSYARCTLIDYSLYIPLLISQHNSTYIHTYIICQCATDYKLYL